MSKLLTVDPRKLQIGDVFGSTSFSFVAWGIRLFTWGASKSFCLDESTHIGTICEREKIIYASEMKPTQKENVYKDLKTGTLVPLEQMVSDGVYTPTSIRTGLQINSLNNYVGKRYRPHIVFVGRHKAFEEKAKRDTLNNFILDMHSRGVRYGFDDIMKYIPCFKWVKDKPQTIICSEWYRECLRAVSIAYPSIWDDEVSPMDIQKWRELRKIPFLL